MAELEYPRWILLPVRYLHLAATVNQLTRLLEKVSFCPISRMMMESRELDLSSIDCQSQRW
jgi:hypothetical protein